MDTTKRPSTTVDSFDAFCRHRIYYLMSIHGLRTVRFDGTSRAAMQASQIRRERERYLRDQGY